MNRPFACALLTALLATPSFAQDEAAGFRFGWPAPANAVVTHRKVTTHEGDEAKPNRNILARFALSVSKPDDEGVVQVAKSNIELVEINGRDASQPMIRQATQPMVAQMNALETVMRVSPDGEFVGIVDWDTHVKRTTAFLEKQAENGDMPKQVVEATLRMLQQPQMQQLAIQKAADPWNIWAGTWVGLELAPEERLETEAAVNFGGVEVPQALVYEHLGSDPANDKLVRLRLTSTMQGEEISRAMRGFVKQMAGELSGGKAEEAEQELADAKVQVITTVTSITDPKTLLPTLAIMEKRILMNVGGKQTKRTDTERFEFDWKK